ncbi:electron transport complex subunit RsxE [Kallipyga gabonensis]|uniref:electron transport complex subunit RsxE n=1 Tax=Kallipyga gabonensis TaxID=1686287 RepID=UPI0006B54C80|nr:electron transport complex subunit E [Kallipyga gabonensis]
MSKKTLFTDGILKNNPVLVQLIGLCSVLAVSTEAINALGMGISLLLVLTASNVVISILRGFIPDEIRIPSFIVVVASFVTILEMALHAFVPDLYNALGIFLPLIVVNCIILGRAEAFAYKNGVVDSLIDGLGNGLGYTLVITAVAIVREFLGNGSFFGMSIIPEDYVLPFFQQPASAYIILGIFIALTTYNRQKKREAELAKPVEPDLSAIERGEA